MPHCLAGIKRWSTQEPAGSGAGYLKEPVVEITSSDPSEIARENAVALAAMKAEDQGGIVPEDVLRANLYGLLSRLLNAPVTLDDLRELAELRGDDGPLGRAINDLAAQARATPPATAAEDFQDLFIGLGRGELVPFGSYYLTGFLNEKPLAKLRDDMGRIGIARDPSVCEPEDHVASVLEIMSGLVIGRFGDRSDSGSHATFFKTHVATWVPHFFKDLADQKTSSLYAAVGVAGQAFMAIEKEAVAFT